MGLDQPVGSGLENLKNYLRKRDFVSVLHQIWSDETLLRPSRVFLGLPNVFLCDQVIKWTLKMVGNSPRSDTENWEESTCRTLGRIAETMANPGIFSMVRTKGSPF